MKNLIGIIGVCSSLYAAQTPLEIVQKLSPKLDINAYITQKIRPEVSQSTKLLLLANISKALATKKIADFWKVSIPLSEGRTTEELFVDVDTGYVANILLSIEWIKKYPEDRENAVDPLSSMIVSLTNIRSQNALDFLGITDEQRNQIVKEGGDLSDSFSSESEL